MIPPVQWRPSPNFGSTARGVLGRLNIAIRAEVKHRIVGSLQSAINVFMDPNRQASTHFGIGLLNGLTAVVQFVDLSDMAWGNGDVRDPTWSRYRAGENPNLSTVSTEHEDGGEANRGRISDATWQASMDLSRLLRSGDVAAIRGAGIHVRDSASLVQLASLPIDNGSYIDHHQIAGPNKPYCLRRWLDDPGFVEGSPSRRDALLAFLAASEVDMPFIEKYEEWTAAAGTPFWLDGPGVGPQKAWTDTGPLTTVAQSVDGNWRIARYQDSPAAPRELLYFRRKPGLTPKVPGGDPLYDAAVVAAIERRTPAADCSAQDATISVLNRKISDARVPAAATVEALR